MKKIEWNTVTWYSQAAAIVLFIVVFGLGFWLGETFELHAFQNALSSSYSVGIGSGTTTPAGNASDIIASVTYACDTQKSVHAVYRDKSVELKLSDGRHLTLPIAISGSGARYANTDESLVFWEKGPTAFMTEGSTTTFANCNETSAATSTVP